MANGRPLPTTASETASSSRSTAVSQADPGGPARLSRDHRRGCVAANVHGKNPQREGTFRQSVVDLTPFHPRLGTLRLEPLPGWTASVERIAIETLAEGLERIRERTDRSAFAHTDMWRIYRRVFLDAYDLPSGRGRP